MIMVLGGGRLWVRSEQGDGLEGLVRFVYIERDVSS